MGPLRSWFALPREGEPVETLQWVRRVEIGIAVVGLVGAAASWSGKWWSWLIVGGSLVSLSPWPGAAAILRKAETRPDVLVTDAQRRKERGRRFLRYFLPIYVVIFTGIGYLLLGVGGAMFFFAVAAVGGGLGAWTLSRMRP